MSKVTNAAAAPMLFESSSGARNAFDQLTSFATPHIGRSNLAFADGHVKTVTAAPPANDGLPAWKPGKK